MKKPLTLFTLILGLGILACSEGNITTNVDLFSFLDASTINYQSEVFTVPSTIPLNQQLPPGTYPSFTTRATPTMVNLLEGGADLMEINNISLSMTMRIESQNFSGSAMLAIYLGTQTDVYNDPTAVKISDKHLTPATFELTSNDSRLIHIFLQDEIVVGIEIIFEPEYITDHKVAVAGLIESFDVEITGRQGIF